MMRTEWFKRTFPKIDDHGRLPTIVERLADAPFRIERKVEGIPEAEGSSVIDEKWSIKKEIGHLIDLEPLWLGRVRDLKNGSEVLRKVDLTNQKTYERDHDAEDLGSLIETFRKDRASLVQEIVAFTEEDIQKSALHPRLKTPMHLVDLAYFVAEHDDHHLSQITLLKKSLNL